ncbi:MAG: succinate dehydrogenase, hydrophobic membrane anchor protein [Alphaproteobacteria bacterium]|nr:succinate dehydrogenase, hydrophobic membrane anchor protein [Alphaproteobacteria bacterium]
MKNKNSMRTPLARVRGIGSAKSGARAWMAMRLSALALIPLSLWFAGSLVWCVQAGDRAAVTEWLHNPVSAGLMILLLAAGFHHGAAGIKEVIEDYVHCEVTKTASFVAIKLGAVALALAGVLAVLKIFLGAGA